MARTGRARREPVTVRIDALSHEGRGIGRVDGKTVFVHGALPGESVEARIVRRRGRFDEAELVEILQPAPDRIEPRCPHFGVCGGCSLQHVGEAYQLRHRQNVLLELLERTAGVVPERLIPPVRGPQWGYRRKARLGAKHVPAKGGVIVGFRERSAPYVTNCEQCDVIDERFGGELLHLRDALRALSIRDRVPQVEIAAGDCAVAAVLRCLAEPSASDRERLAEFAQASGVQVYLQPAGPDSITPLLSDPGPLSYAVQDLTLHFLPVDFTQVNASINAQLVDLALDLMALQPGDSVADLFCGIGNFSLPMARAAAHVYGYEGAPELVERARANAASNDVANCSFAVCDLAAPAAVQSIAAADKVLLDPPRSGAQAVVEHLPLDAAERVVYVSCNPATLARDAAALCNTGAFALEQAGILDMFPQTAHFESIAVFARR